MPSGKGVAHFEDQRLKSPSPPRRPPDPSKALHPRPFPLPVRPAAPRPAPSGPGGLIPLAGGSGWKRRVEKAARSFPRSSLRRGPQPGTSVCPSAWPHPARPSAPQVSASAVRSASPFRSRLSGGRAGQWSPPPFMGPGPWTRCLAFPNPRFFSSVSDGSGRTHRRRDR